VLSGRKEGQMLVRDILQITGADVVSVSPDQTMAEVVRLFRETNIGFVLVRLSPRDFVGTVSERNCCHAVAEHGAAAASMRVADIMNRVVAICSTSDPLQTVMAIMTEQRTRHVLVMNGEELAGLVSIGDVVKHRLDESLQTERLLGEYIAGAGFR
jgi:CBS domain-containing protein